MLQHAETMTSPVCALGLFRRAEIKKRTSPLFSQIRRSETIEVWNRARHSRFLSWPLRRSREAPSGSELYEAHTKERNNPADGWRAARSERGGEYGGEQAPSSRNEDGGSAARSSRNEQEPIPPPSPLDPWGSISGADVVVERGDQASRSVPERRRSDREWKEQQFTESGSLGEVAKQNKNNVHISIFFTSVRRDIGRFKGS